MHGNISFAVAAALAACIGLGLAACEKPRKAEGPVQQRLITATLSDPKTFNPLVMAETSSTTVINDLFESLLRLNPKTLQLEPALAERWDVSPDGKTITFRIRPGLRWSDGVPLTAGDVKFTYDAIFDPKVPSPDRSLLTLDGKPIRVSTEGDSIVRFTLPYPFAPAIELLGGESVLPQHILGEALRKGTFASAWSIDTPPSNLVGTGPSVMTEYRQGQYVKYKRNPYYWRKDPDGKPYPYLEEQILLIVQDQNTIQAKFLAGESDIHAPRLEEVTDLKRRANELNIVVRDIGLSPSSLYLGFNRNPAYAKKSPANTVKLSWFSDPRFTRAVAHAVDHQAIINSVFKGFGQAAASVFSPAIGPFYNDGLKPIPYDTKEAVRLLTEAGFVKGPDGTLTDRAGHPVEFDLYTNAGNRDREQIAAILKQDLTALGMKVNFKPLDFNNLTERLQSNFEWDVILIGFTGSRDPHFGSNLYLSSGPQHFWYPNQRKPATAWEAEVDRLMDEGSREMDPVKRAGAYKQIQKLFDEQMPIIPLVNVPSFGAYKTRVKNYEPYVWGALEPERIMIQP